MHKSQLGGIIIDCNVDDIEEASLFWAKALGYEIIRSTDPADDNYRSLQTGGNDLDIEVQKVSHSSRVHIDIETNDIQAEAKRLEKLGAKRVSSIRGWVVMESPTGQRFCLVTPQRANFDTEANFWE